MQARGTPTSLKSSLNKEHWAVGSCEAERQLRLKAKVALPPEGPQKRKKSHRESEMLLLVLCAHSLGSGDTCQLFGLFCDIRQSCDCGPPIP